MNVHDPLKLVSQLLDLPIIDLDERWCGIVDDVELKGEARKRMQISALLVGPGAYKGRLPHWLFWIARRIAGERMTRVPVEEISEIGAVVKLRSRAEALGLHATEDRLRSWIPRVGAM